MKIYLAGGNFTFQFYDLLVIRLKGTRLFSYHYSTNNRISKLYENLSSQHSSGT